MTAGLLIRIARSGMTGATIAEHGFRAPCGSSGVGRSGGAGLSAEVPDVGFVADVDGALGAALIKRAEVPKPVTLNEEADDGFSAAPGVAHHALPNGVRA